MTMQPLTAATEAVLRLLWQRGANGRLVDLGAINLVQLRRAVQLGLVEIQQTRGRNRARLTFPGRYYARLVATAPAPAQPRQHTLQMRLPDAGKATPLERWIAGGGGGQ